MTLDSQRWDNINWTRDFLVQLAITPRSRLSAAEIKKRAAQLLKHYPEPHWVEEMRAKARSDAG